MTREIDNLPEITGLSMRAMLAVLVRATVRLDSPYPVIPGQRSWHFAAGLAAAVAKGASVDRAEVSALLDKPGRATEFLPLALAALAVADVAEVGQLSDGLEAPALEGLESVARGAILAAGETIARARPQTAAGTRTSRNWSQAAWRRDLKRAASLSPGSRDDPLGGPVEIGCNGPFGEVWPWECWSDGQALEDYFRSLFFVGQNPIGSVFDAVIDEFDVGNLRPWDTLLWYTVRDGVAGVSKRLDGLFPDGLSGGRGPRLMAYVGAEPLPYEIEVGLIRCGVRLLLPADFGGKPPRGRREFFIRVRQFLAHAQLGIGLEHRPVFEPPLASFGTLPDLQVTASYMQSGGREDMGAEPDPLKTEYADEQELFESELTQRQLALADVELAALVAQAGAPSPWDEGPKPIGQTEDRSTGPQW